MRENVSSEFVFRADIVQLNHASYGFPTRATLEHVNRLRRDLELDPAASLGAHVVDRLAETAAAVREYLGLPDGQLALALNSTEAHETVVRSLLDARSGFVVSMLDDEYESVQTTWKHSHARGTSELRMVDGHTKADDALPPDVSVESVVASSTARRAYPGGSAPTWVRIVDASHAPGHVPLQDWAAQPGRTAVVGSLHKWLPALRPAGFVWFSPEWDIDIVPAIASLRTSPDPMQHLSWRGTWDPVPHLAVPYAIDQWLQWETDGLIHSAEALALDASEALVGAGLQEWNTESSRAPRLRSFIVPDTSSETLKEAFEQAGINAWIGVQKSTTILRLAFNIYNDMNDVERVLDVVGGLRRC